MTIAGHVLNGLSFGMLLFLLAAGMTISFGLMRVVNLAHGSFYLLAGYIGIAVLGEHFGYLAALLAAIAAAALLALVVERLTATSPGDDLAQIMLTVGVAFIVSDLAIVIWGSLPEVPQAPPGLDFSIHWNGLTYPVYRLALIVIGLGVAVLTGLVLTRTMIGARIRASVDDRGMARAMGIRVPRLLQVTFLISGALAGFAGLIGGNFTGIFPGVDLSIVLLSVVIVIVGGLGSLSGAFVGSILIGLLNEFGQSYFPDFSYFTLYVPVIAILLLRPQGLFGRSS